MPETMPRAPCSTLATDQGLAPSRTVRSQSWNRRRKCERVTSLLRIATDRSRRPILPVVRALRGSCACGATEYEVEDAFVYAMNCHCSKCRAATGSAYKPMGGIEREKLRVTREDVPMFIWGEPDAGDFRCGVCGSFLYSIVRAGKWAHVTFGSLLEAPSRQPDHHIFVGSKASWDEIRDELPQYEGYAK